MLFKMQKLKTMVYLEHTHFQSGIFPRIAFILWIGLFVQCSGNSQAGLIDLSNVCNKENVTGECVQWYIKEGFDDRLFLLDKSAPELQSEIWLKPESIKMWINKLYDNPDHKSFGSWSFVTWFDYDVAEIHSQNIPGILLAEIGEAFTIYINGHEIVTEGTIRENDVVFHRTVRGISYPIRSDLLKKKNNQLLIKLSGDPRFEHTGFYATQDYLLGDLKQLQYHRRDLTGLILIFIYLVIGVYHLLLYLIRRQEKDYLNYALFSLFIFIYLLTRHDIIFTLPLDSILIQKVELSVLYLLLVSTLIFVENKLFQKISFFSRFIVLLYWLGAIVSPVMPIHLSEYILKILLITTVLVLIPYIMFIMIRAKIKDKTDAGRMLFGLSILMGGAVFDILDSLIFNTGVAVSKYAMAFFVLGIGATLANRFMQIHNEVEELNVNLEKKVEIRTSELQNTLSTVQELKVRQDGDYFLTSLLLKPLNGNFSKNTNVSIEIYLKQKKEFKFRHWETEIGGDLCLTYDLVLRGREYVAFINADAMGKSIQGAGGALVGGVVFKSVVTRTQLSATSQNKMPERWLKDCFSELQNTFVSFDGSMLISAVIGLVDSTTGLVYYLNAEHPYPILYREQKARFIGSNSILRKIGIEDINTRFYIKTLQVKSNDVLYIGSDGRDDLLIGEKNGKRIINENDSLFKDLVETSNGNLSELIQALEQVGELTDDLSLIRIAYKEDFPVEMNAPPLEIFNKIEKLEGKMASNSRQILAEIREILNQYPNLAQAHKMAAILYAKTNDYVSARNHMQSYLNFNPEDINGMFKFVLYNKKLKDYNTAIDYAEAIRLRERTNIRNLISLADCYRLRGSHTRAARIVKEAELISGEEPNLVKLKKLLNV